MIEILALGPLRVRSADGMRLLTGVGARLLAYLLLQKRSGHRVERSRLAGAIWPELPESQARQLLSSALYRLRQMGTALSSSLFSQGEWIELRDFESDLDRFTMLLSSASAQDWRQALDLYGGDLLSEIDAEWIHGPRFDLKTRFLFGLKQSCERLEKEGDFEGALEIALRWNRTEPTSEEALRGLLHLYAECGRSEDGLRHYARFCQERKNQGEEPPSQTTQLLAERIGAEQRAPAETGESANPLIGRKRERSLLFAALNRLDKGDGGTIWVEGEAGAGKSRLLAEVAEVARWREVRSCEGRSAPISPTQPFSPLFEAIEGVGTGPQLSRIRASLSPIALSQLRPLLPQVAPSVTGSASGPPAGNALGLALERLLECLCDERPLLLILDDLQWASTGFWSLLSPLLTLTARLPFLVILSFRGDEMRQNQEGWNHLTELESQLFPERIRLEGLTRAECASLASNLGRTLGSEELERLYRLSGGNPLILGELIHSGQEVSPTFEEALARRMGQLSSQALEALNAAAVLGHDFDHGSWQSLLRERPPATELVLRGFLRETRAGYSFQHDLVRAYLYRNLSSDERRLWHGSIADRARIDEENPGLLAWHLEQAGRLPESIHYHRRAAEAALLLYDSHTAQDHAQQALRLAASEQLSESEWLPLRCLVLRTQQVSSWSSQAFEEVIRLGERAQELLDGESHHYLLLLQLRYAMARGEMQKLEALGDKAVERVGELGDPQLEILTLVEVASLVATHIRNLDRAIELAQRAVGLAESYGHAHLLFSALITLATPYLHARNLEAATTVLERAESVLAANPGLAHLEAELRNMQAIQAQIEGSWEKARSLQNRLVDLYEGSGEGLKLMRALYASSHIASFIGQHEEAILYGERLVDAVRIHESEVDRYLPHFFRSLLAEAYTLGGHYEESERVLEPVRKWLLQHPEGGRGVTAGWSAIGNLAFYQGKLDVALSAFERVLELAEHAGSVTSAPYLCHAETAHRLSMHQEARRSLEKAQEIATPGLVSSNTTFLHWVRYLVLGERDALLEAAEAMHHLLDRFEEPRLRTDYLERMPLHRDILEALGEEGPGRHRVRLAQRDAPLGRSLRPEETKEIVWTVDGGVVDGEFARANGVTALRRRRLLRMSREAAAQGALATYADLARGLGVSERTVERDAARLAGVGRIVPTRRRRGNLDPHANQ